MTSSKNESNHKTLQLTKREAYDLAYGIVGAFNSNKRNVPWAPTTDNRLVADLFDAMAEQLRLPVRAYREGAAKRDK